jgi:hypothetical protein
MDLPQDGLLQAIGIARLEEVRAEADRILSGMLSVGFRVSENERASPLTGGTHYRYWRSGAEHSPNRHRRVQ